MRLPRSGMLLLLIGAWLFRGVVMKGTFVVGLVLLASSLSGCGIADHYQAQSRMEKSEDAYRQCLLQHTTDPASCNELKKFYEQDKAAYEKT